MGSFQKGDRVKVRMLYNDIFPFQRGPAFEATYLRGPQGPGDTFSFDVDGEPVEINGNSQLFIGITRTPPDSETES